MRPIPKPKHQVAVAIFVAVSVGVGVLAVMSHRTSATQAHLASAALKEHDPSLFPHDPVYGPSAMWQVYSPVPQGVLRMVLVPTGYREAILPFRLMAGVLALVYLCGMYALLYRHCRSWSISAYVAIMSMVIVWSVGEAFWGVGPLESITPRAACLAVTPLLLLAYLRYENQWRLLLVFLLIGLMGNVHLGMAMDLTVVLVVTYLVRRITSIRAWGRVVGCVIAAAVGAMPYVWYCLQLRQEMSGSVFVMPVTTSTVYQAFRLSGLLMMYPDLLKPLLHWVLISAVLALPAVAVLSRVERFRARQLRFWISFLVISLVVSLGVSGAMEGVAHFRGRPLPIMPPVGASCLAMAALYVLFAQALTNLFRLIRTHRAWLQWACVVLMLAWVFPSDNFRVARYALLDTASVFMDEAEKPRSIQKHHARYHEQAELAAIAAWARANTPTDAIFLTANGEFRMLSRRSIVVGEDDATVLYYFAPSRLEQWLRDMTDVGHLLHPATGRVESAAVRDYVLQLETRPLFQAAQRWYAIITADVAPPDEGVLERIDGDWGKHYTLYRVNIAP